MPLNIDFFQILLHMLNFVILAGGLTLLLYKPVKKFLDERREQFVKQERQNEENSRNNEQLKVQYEQKLQEAAEEIAVKRLETEKEMTAAAKRCLDEAHSHAADIVAAAESEAEKHKESILESAQTEIGELVVSAAQKLLSNTETSERDRALYDDFIKLTKNSQSADKRTRK